MFYGMPRKYEGFHHTHDIDLIHNRFCRFISNLLKVYILLTIYSELGHLSMYRHHKIMEYLCHIILNKPSVVYYVYMLLCTKCNDGVRIRVIVFNATFNNISVISWRSVLLVRETGVLGENHRRVVSY